MSPETNAKELLAAVERAKLQIQDRIAGLKAQRALIDEELLALGAGEKPARKRKPGRPEGSKNKPKVKPTPRQSLESARRRLDVSLRVDPAKPGSWTRLVAAIWQERRAERRHRRWVAARGWRGPSSEPEGGEQEVSE